jgi:hypothetical protein
MTVKSEQAWAYLRRTEQYIYGSISERGFAGRTSSLTTPLLLTSYLGNVCL